MRVLTVIPITNNQYLNDLTYFSLKNIPLGSVVDITLRNKIVPALVIKSADASKMKAILRGGDFTLKRLGDTAPREVLTPAFIKAAEFTAQYHASTLGSVISTMVHNTILNCKDIEVKPQIDTFRRYTHDAYALQATSDERVTMYKNLTRETLARGRSIVIVVTGAIRADKLYDELKGGIENKTHILSSKISKTKLSKIVTKISNSKEAMLLIATPKFATINIHKLGTMIIDDEDSVAYHTKNRPYIDTTIFLAEYAKKLRIRLILAATVLSTRTHLAMRNGEIMELAPLSTRQRSKVDIQIIDARKDTKNLDLKKSDKSKQFTPLEESIKDTIIKSLTENKKLFMLAPRNGLAPTTICRDCNSTVICDKCGTPMTLHKTTGDLREYLCGRCGHTSDPDTTCKYCGSWRLETLGLGIELIEDELKKLNKKAKIIRIDKKTTKTDKVIRDAIAKFEQSKKSILLGTQLAIPFIKKVDTCIVASLDAMLSVPSFNIDERVFSMLLKLKDLTNDKMLIQTRMPERPALTLAVSGDISNFMRQELELRKTLKYPPYTLMIKITATGSKRQIIHNFQHIMPYLEPYGPRVFRQFRRLSPTRFALHALLRIPSANWPDEELVQILRELQPKFEVKVDVE